MKRIIILGDGMADYPVPELNNRTPLMAAETPGMDTIARNGRTGLFKTIEDDMATGSAVANLSVLGYDPRVTFQGRGVLEAASLGVHLSETDLAMRVNLISIEDGKIRSHSSGHISNEEAGVLIQDLNTHFRSWPMSLTQGLSYRHLLVAPGMDARIACSPPHDHVDESFEACLVKPLVAEAAGTADSLNRMIRESQNFLNNHAVNRKRRDEGKLPANSLWPWSPGHKPKMKTFMERFGVTGAAISAVDLIKGLAIYAGLDVINVKGATGLYDTNYEGKADACLTALESRDFVYVHVEAPDEAGHERNYKLKIQCLEDLDRRLIRRILNGLQKKNIEAVIGLLPDHATPVSCGCHVRDAVPVAIWNPAVRGDETELFDEENVKKGSLGLLRGDSFINLLFEKNAQEV